MVTILKALVGIILLCNSHVRANDDNKFYDALDNFEYTRDNWFDRIQSSCPDKTIPLITTTLTFNGDNYGTTSDGIKFKSQTFNKWTPSINRLSREVCGLAALKGTSNIVQLIGINENHNYVHIIMEYYNDIKLPDYLNLIKKAKNRVCSHYLPKMISNTFFSFKELH